MHFTQEYENIIYNNWWKISGFQYSKAVQGILRKKIAELLVLQSWDLDSKLQWINRILQYWFGLSVSDLSKEEIEDMQLVLWFLFMRSLHGYLWWDMNAAHSIEWEKSIIFHDLSHSIVRYIMNPKSPIKESQRFLPTPFRYPQKRYLTHQNSLYEECYALLFMFSFAEDGNNVPLSIIKENAENIYDSETLYQYIVSRLKRFWDFQINQNLPYSEKWIKDCFDQLDRDENFKRLIQYIYNNRKNKRVMVDLFLQEMQPLIEQLKKRKSYTGEERKPQEKLSINNPPLA